MSIRGDGGKMNTYPYWQEVVQFVRLGHVSPSIRRNRWKIAEMPNGKKMKQSDNGQKRLKAKEEEKREEVSCSAREGQEIWNILKIMRKWRGHRARNRLLRARTIRAEFLLVIENVNQWKWHLLCRKEIQRITIITIKIINNNCIARITAITTTTTTTIVIIMATRLLSLANGKIALLICYRLKCFRGQWDKGKENGREGREKCPLFRTNWTIASCEACPSKITYRHIFLSANQERSYR